MTTRAAKPRRLLVIEDDADVSFTICAIAQHARFETCSAASFDEVLARLDSWNPTHIVVDLAMPNVDGVETLQRLARIGTDASVIVASGLGTKILEAAARAAAESGIRVAGILPKPFTPARLRALLAAEPGGAGRGVPREAGGNGAAAFEVTEEALAAALEARDIRVHFQPKVSCATGELVGFEALARWAHPDFGLIMPNRFIPLAERSGLVGRLTRQVFAQALAWHAGSFRDGNAAIALNLSAVILGDADLSGWIFQQCSRLEIPPERITIEVTETSTLHNTVAMLENLTRFRIRGFNLSIDDFGVGYSSLVQLARLPFTEIKIDRMFVGSASASDESQKIVSAIVGLGRALGLYVTAEGVEDAWTLDFLRSIGCDAAQGFLFARPMDGPAALDWVASRRHQPGGAS